MAIAVAHDEEAGIIGHAPLRIYPLTCKPGSGRCPSKRAWAARRGFRCQTV